MKSTLFILTGLVLVLTFDACRKSEEVPDEAFDERMSGGSQTVFNEGVSAFAQAFPYLSAFRSEQHEIGDAAFEATFVAAPAPFMHGLGTLYNSNSCFNCHINDGRGKPIYSNEQLASMLFRVSVPGTDAHGGPLAAPGFGGQLQDKAVFGHASEASVNVNWTENTITLAGGETISLRSPQWIFSNHYTPAPAGMLYSARVAPPVHGLGLLEQVDESTLLAFADENDRDGDGISGKPNYTYDAKSGQTMIGRFGWKAEAPTLDQQVAGAYNEDMGITSYILPIENSRNQIQFDNLADDAEVPDSVFNAVVVYVRTLAVPARRNVTDPLVKRGKELFKAAKCAGCHIPSMRTKTDVSFPEASNQRIQPYTDLLLHDMGDELADNRPTFRATGNEWRTPPLWGIGLTQVVNGHNYFLHDGRARNLLEAILWHGGEGSYSSNYVKNLAPADREALIAFLKSL